MKYRHEWKYRISYGDMLILCQRLSAVAKRDIHTKNGKYVVHSLYFDHASDKALRDKIEGVNIREKFRIRYYNDDLKVIHLEKKCKVNGLCLKENAPLFKEQAACLAEGNFEWMAQSGNSLVLEFYSKLCGGLQPKIIVGYTREAFVFSPGNVRVTIDYNIRTGQNCRDFLNPSCITLPVRDAPIILEVKWDEYLPDIIRDAVSLKGRRPGALSKYAACRVYG
ncbi:MAG: polyphosphate polymerase domain-containing protein [Lachnospiraceae bacterium]|nr:polyphosphate polymerase domain-containing protein [Lachnospiraceae bacterium]